MAENCSHPGYFETSEECNGEYLNRRVCKACMQVLWQEGFYQGTLRIASLPDYNFDTGKHTDRYGVLSTCPEHSVGACCKEPESSSKEESEKFQASVVTALGPCGFDNLLTNGGEWDIVLTKEEFPKLYYESELSSPATKMDLTKYEDDLKNTVDGWDEEFCAAIYLHLYRMGMRVNKAEGIVDRMRRRKD